MNHKAVYELSARYGPPKIDLRRAEILDSYGDESGAAWAINHDVPADVTREDFEHYGGWVWPFMKLESLLFYLYPVASLYAEALSFQQQSSFDTIEFYLMCLDGQLKAKYSSMSLVDQQAVVEGLVWICDLYSAADSEDFNSYKFLRRLVNDWLAR